MQKTTFSKVLKSILFTRILLVFGVLFLLFSIESFSQKLIFNEYSQGASGAKDGIELLVVGDCTTNPTLDLRGWFVDDNNGLYTNPTSKKGCFRFTQDDQWKAVPIGSIIIIYNLDYITVGPPKVSTFPLADDESDLIVKDSVYVLSIQSNFLLHSSKIPDQSDPAKYDYSFSSLYYSPTPTPTEYILSSSVSSVNTIAAAQATALFQTRKATNTLKTSKPEFAIYWGSESEITGTVKIGSLFNSTTKKVGFLQDSLYNNATSWTIDAIGFESLGIGNTPANKAWIKNMRKVKRPDKTVSVTSDKKTICLGETAAIDVGKITPTQSNSYSYTLRNNTDNSIVGVLINGNSGKITFNVSPTTTTTYNVLATEIIPGCINQLDSIITITVNPLPTVNALTGTNTVCVGLTTTFSCTTSNGVFSSSNTAIATVNSSTGVITGISAGTVTISYAVTTNGCTTTVTRDVTVNANPTVNPLTGTQNVCVGATTTFSSTTTPGTFSSSNLSVATVDANTGMITAISIGTSTISYTVSVSGCATTITRDATVNSTPTITGTTPASRCGTGTVTLGATPSAGTVSWYDAPTGGTLLGTGTSFITPSISTTTTYYTDATNNGCTTATRTAVVATVNPIPSTPVVGTITQPSCSAPTGSVALSDLPLGAWTINPGVITGTGATTTISSLTALTTYNFTVTETTTGCTSLVSNNVVINAQPTAPAQPILSAVIQPTCVVSLGGFTVTNYNASYTYSVSPSTSVIISGNDIAAPAGSYTVTATLGACTSVASTSAVINAQPTTPVQPILSAVTHPTCATATGSFTITNFNGTYTYTVNPSVGVSQIGNTVTALEGTYTITATLGTCVSIASTNTTVNAQPITPAQPILSAVIQPTCVVSLGGFTITNYNASYNYSVSPSTSVIISGNDIAAPAGSYTVTATLGACTSVASTSAVINTQPTTPIITSTTPSSRCGTGTVTLGASASAGTINWYDVPTGGSSLGPGLTFTTPSISTTTTYYVDATSGGCTSPTRTAVIATINPIPTIITTTPASRCGTGTVTLGSTTTSGTINWYTVATGGISQGVGTSFTTPSISTTTTYYVDAIDNGCTTPTRTAIVASVFNPIITGTTHASSCGAATLTLGATASLGTINWFANSTGGAPLASGTTYTTPSISATTTYYVDATDNGCTTPTRTAIIATINTIPTIATIIPASRCGTGTVILGATATSGTLNWYSTATGGSSLGTGTTYTTPSISITTTYYVDATENGCTTPTRTAIVATVNSVPNISILSSSIPSSCGDPSGVIFITGNGKGDLSWAGTTSGSATIISLPYPISYLKAGSYNITLTDNGCTSTNINFVLNDPNPPSTPIISVIGSTTFCTGGSVILKSSSATGNIWSTNETTESITVSTTGNYNVKVFIGACSASSTSTNVTVNLIPSTPIVGTITQPSCATTTGSVILSGLPTGAWMINPGAIVGSGSTTTLSNLTASSTYNFIVTETSTNCTSLASADVVINAQSATVTAPLVGVITHPSCASPTGSVDLSGLPAGPWIINPGAIAGSGPTFNLNGLTASTTYNFTVTAAGCTSAPSSNVVINALASTLSAPIVGIITQPTCATATGSVVLNGLPVGVWVLNPGAIAGSGTSTTISGLTAGTYNYTVSAAGCTSVASANISINVQPSTPSIPIIGTITQPTCSTPTGSVVLNDLPNGAWTLNPGAITGSGATTILSGLIASTTYNYTVTSSGCISVASADVAILAQPSLPSISFGTKVNPNSCGTSTGSIEIQGSGAGNISWTGASVGSASSVTFPYTALNLIAGSYNFVFDEGGCISNTITGSISDPGAPSTPTISTGGDPTTFCAGGSVTLTSTPEPGGGSYLWTPGGSTAQSIPVTNSGSYTVKITDASGCSSSSLVTSVTVNPIPTVNPLFGNQNVCEGLTTTFSSITVGGSFSSSNTAIATVNSSGLITTLSAGTATISYTVSANGCSKTVTRDVTVSQTPTLIINPPLAVFQPTTVDITASSITAGSTVGTIFSYWTNSTGTLSLNSPNVISNSGTYYIKGTIGVCSDIQPVTVTINSSTALVINNPAAVCSPNTVDITASSITAGSSSIGILSYWEDIACTIPLSNPTSINVSGTYYVKSTLGLSEDIKPVAVNINSTPTLVITSPSPICSPLTIDLTAPEVTNGSTSGTTFSYWKNAGGTSPLTNANNLSSSGTYYIKGVLGQCSDIKVVVATINSPPTATITASGPITFCTGSDVQLTASVGTSYLWSDGSTEQSITVSTTSDNSVEVTDANGCSATSPTTVVTANQAPAAVITANGPTTFCAGGNVKLTSSPANNYLWSNGEKTQSITVSSTLSYSAYITENGCSVFTNTISVIVNPLPSASVGINSTICEGDSKQIGNTAIVGNTYSWASNPSGFTSTTANPTVNPVSTTTYTLTEKITATTCSNQNSITVTVNPAPVIDGSITKDILCFGDANGQLTASATGGTSPYTYSWIDNLGSPISNTTNKVTGLISGTYQVSVTDNKNCSSLTSKTLTFSAPSKISFSLDSIDVNCFGKSNGSAFVTNGNVSGGTGNLNYQWYSIINGSGIVIFEETQPVLINQPAGKYRLAVTDDNKCLKDDTTIINEPLTLTNTFVKQDIQCYGQNTGKVTSNVAGGQGKGYSLVWTNPEIGKEQYSSLPNASITELKADKDYILQIIDASDVSGQCYILDTARLSQPNKLTATIATTNNKCYGNSDGQIKVNASGGVPIYEFWMNGKINTPNKNSDLFTTLSSGKYSITITDANKCSLTIKDSLVDPPRDPVAKFTYSPEEITHINLTANFINNSIGATINKWDFAGLESSALLNPSFTFPDTGQYKITLFVENSKGCTSSDSILLKVIEASQLFIPTSFSPDGDGLNDTFKPAFYGDPIKNYKLSIFNKWGEQLFYTDNLNFEWNGLNRQLTETVPNGTYVYIVEIETTTGKNINQSGTFSIVR